MKQVKIPWDNKKFINQTVPKKSIINHILKKALSSLAEIIAEQCKKNYLSNYKLLSNHVVQALGHKSQLHKKLCYAGQNMANYSVQLPTCPLRNQTQKSTQICKRASLSTKYMDLQREVSFVRKGQGNTVKVVN